VKGETEMGIRETARENFSLWATALLTRDPKKVAELYSEDATFLPTVSPDFKKGKAQAEGYFKHFLEKNPNGAVTAEEVQALGDNAYLHSGLYDFELDQGSGRVVVDARFSFVWRKESNGEWKIIHHHSSVRP
jgi:uncharacterized protein (TIGR02246 family)